jgi:hypothetical protein
MTVWVVRKSPSGETIGEPQLCARPGRIDREPGMLSLEEQIATLLGDDEKVAEGIAIGRLRIQAGNRLAGFIDVLEDARAR